MKLKKPIKDGIWYKPYLTMPQKPNFKNF